MKRIAIAFLKAASCAAILFALASCEASGKPRIGVTLYSVEDSFISAARRSLQSEAEGKARLSILDGQGQQSIQNEQISAMFADKASAIIVNPVDIGAITGLVFTAKAANVPLVLFCRTASTVPVIMWDKAYFVGARSEEADALQIEILADYWKDNPAADKNQDGIVQYVLVRGDSNHAAALTSAEIRQKAFDAAGLKSQKLTEIDANLTRLEAQQKMGDVITNLGAQRIEAVICANDEMALGVIEAFKIAGLMKGPNDRVPVIGVDGTNYALDSIADGMLCGTVRADASAQGRAAFDLAYALSMGENPAAAGWPLTNGKYVFVPYQKVTWENYKTFGR
jgi:methyl-galactoside transport system substrate-binding protein